MPTTSSTTTTPRMNIIGAATAVIAISLLYPSPTKTSSPCFSASNRQDSSRFQPEKHAPHILYPLPGSHRWSRRGCRSNPTPTCSNSSLSQFAAAHVGFPRRLSQGDLLWRFAGCHTPPEYATLHTTGETSVGYSSTSTWTEPSGVRWKNLISSGVSITTLSPPSDR